QPRETLVQRLEGQPHARRSARSKVLYQHVSLGQQLVEYLGGFLLLDVQGQAFLGTVGPDEMRGQAIDTLVVAPGEVTGTGPLHLDHPGAEVGQLARAERRGDGVLEADHGDAVEGTRLGSRSVHKGFLQSSIQTGDGPCVGASLLAKPLSRASSLLQV